MNLEEYKKIDNTIDMKDITEKSIGILLVSFITYVVLYGLLHKEFFLSGLLEIDSLLNEEWNFIVDFAVFILMYAILAVFHEGIHAVTCLGDEKVSYKDIKFGILMEYVTPYFHCKVPICVTRYKLVLLMPTIILGFLPSVLGLILGNAVLTSYGFIMFVGGVGDFMVYKALKKYKNNDLIMDNPNSVGFVAYVKED